MYKYLKFILIISIVGIIFSCNKTKSTNTSDNISGKEKDISIETNNDDSKTDSAKRENTATAIYAIKQVPVLCYHRIENGRNDDYTVSPDAFAAQMQILVDSGYHSILPDQLYDYLVYNEKLPEKPVMITFDDSREEHALIAAPELEKRGMKGVFFIMTITFNKKNYMSTDQIVSLAKRGHVIALHSWDHTKATKYVNDSILKVNIIQPKKKLEELIGMPVNYFAYPYGITNEQTCNIMKQFFKISFILSTKQDPERPLQSVRRMIVPSGWTPQGLLRAMNKTFNR